MPRLTLRPSLLATILLLVTLLASCKSPQLNSDITITVTADGTTRDITVPQGQTVSQALESAGITVNSLDKTEPPLYTVIGNGDLVTLIRVEEVFETEVIVVPFERQVVRDETLAGGETRLVPAG